MRRWKLSPTDLESILRWEDYSRAKDAMFAATDTAGVAVVDGRQRRQAQRAPERDQPPAQQRPVQAAGTGDISIPDRPDADDYERPPIEQFHYVPDIAAELAAKKQRTAGIMSDLRTATA